MIVREWMTAEPVTVSGDATLMDAVTLMRRHRIRHLPVIEGTQLVGILTDRDLKRATPSLFSAEPEQEYERVLRSATVREIMTRDPLVVARQTSMTEAVGIMLDRKIGALPVVEQNQLVGIMTEADCLRLLRTLLTQQATAE